MELKKKGVWLKFTLYTLRTINKNKLNIEKVQMNTFSVSLCNYIIILIFKNLLFVNLLKKICSFL